ncbi:MAG: hypothetical protein A2017_18505 [Lentisphaerae bacterium GWF2_44_16]|nr:MAG: hypothetical protein A2017_18505 [Lentisphaerae bacterium GWF2_44_16]
MGIINQKSAFYELMEKECEISGFTSIASIPLDTKKMKVLSSELNVFFQGNKISKWPGYIKKTAAARADIISAFPWGKSLIMTALPFRMVPASKNKLPEAECDELSGLIAGYAANKTDYHIHLNFLLKGLLERLSEFSGMEIRAEICIDTKPLAEKPLAAISGLGKIGMNSCILCPDEGSGICIGSIISSLSLPEYHSSKAVDIPCSNCAKCRKSCPAGAIGEKNEAFEIDRCISYLSMEKKGILTAEERKMLGEWIFGCDICTSSCPDSNIPPPVAIDLQWLLLSSAKEIEKTIADTPLAHTGITRLRRNAMAVLANKKSEQSTALLEKCILTLNSDLLKETAYQILNEKDIKL